MKPDTYISAEYKTKFHHLIGEANPGMHNEDDYAHLQSR